MRRPLRGRFALFASWLTGAVALVSLFATGNAAADGYNTWPGGLVALGELEISPQWQVALPYRDASSSPLMLQAGLADGFDLALNTGLDLFPDGAAAMPISMVPRWGLGERATVGIGLGWSPGDDLGVLQALPVLTWAWEPGGAWRGDANLFGAIDLEGGFATTVDLVVHVERALVGHLAALVEVNLQATGLPDRVDHTAIVFGGLFLRPRQCDMVTLALGWPAAGNDGDRRPIIGAWWNHVIDLGFGERKCRRGPPVALRQQGPRRR